MKYYDLRIYGFLKVEIQIVFNYDQIFIRLF